MSPISELLDRFRLGPELLERALEGAHGELVDFEPAPGKWTIRQILAHVADSDLVYAQRFRQIVAEDNPTIAAFDQDKWAANLDYARRDVRQSLESFRRVRAESGELLRGLEESAYRRTGQHTERGAVTLRDMVASVAGHVEGHARQVEQIRETYRQTKETK